ncbi:hypothetical protein DPMN_166975 [Dreissena polymorpha]|uniref:Uncharacterized protein n=1 Tax=Dreissena polymorpha TaxID=45954 RepID=A0A9D4EZJ8_DREPO|nr:hypothetical protein DPMN_166975 [Dreissena polymorpha]
MRGYLCNPDSEPYDNYILKKHLKTRFNDTLHFAGGEGLDDIVTIRKQTLQILRSYYKRKCEEKDEESQKRAIIETASRFIKSDIKSEVVTLTNWYPSSEDLKLESALSFFPTSLRTQLETLFYGKRHKTQGCGSCSCYYSSSLSTSCHCTTASGTCCTNPLSISV